MADLFKNWATSTISGSLTAVATTVNVAAGEGVRFPSPTGGDSFRIVMVNKTNGDVEVATCTARSTDALTITRASEDIFGAAAAGKAFSDGDLIYNTPTAGFFDQYMVSQKFQSGAPIYGTTAGSGGAYTLGLTPAATAVPTEGSLLVINANHASIGGTNTLNIDSQGAKEIRKFQDGANIALAASDLQAGFVYFLVYEDPYWIVHTPLVGSSASLNVGTGDGDLVTNGTLTGTTRTFTALQLASRRTSSNSVDGTAVTWDMSTHQILHHNINTAAAPTITLSSPVVGHSYQLLIQRTTTGQAYSFAGITPILGQNLIAEDTAKTYSVTHLVCVATDTLFQIAQENTAT